MQIKYDNMPEIIRITAMPVPLPNKFRDKLRLDKWHVNPAGADAPAEVKKGDLKDIDKNILFTLPKVYSSAKPEDIKTIDGKNYLIVDIEPGKFYKDPPKGVMVGKNPVTGEPKWYSGQVVAIDIDTGDIKTFTHDKVKDELLQNAQNLSSETLKKANEDIRAYNKRLALIDNVTSLTQLPLQLERLGMEIDNRVETLQGMIDATKTKINMAVSNGLQDMDFEKAKPPAAQEWEKWLDEQIAASALPQQDFLDTLFFRYQYRPDQLVADLKAGNIPMPTDLGTTHVEDFKKKVLQLAEISNKRYQEHLQKEKEEKAPQEVHVLDHDVGIINELQSGDIPGASGKATGYKGFEAYVKSQKAIIAGCEKDKHELVDLRSEITKKCQEIGHLPPGFRSNVNMTQTEEGEKYTHELVDWFNNTVGGFIARYQSKIVTDGKLNSKLFGNKGSLGNAGVAIFAQRIFAAAQKLLTSLLQGIGQSGVAKEQVPVAVPAANQVG